MMTATRRLFLFLSLALLLCPLWSAFAEMEMEVLLEDDPALMQNLDEELSAAGEEAGREEEKYVAIAAVTLKVRNGPGQEYKGIYSLPKDSLVYILDLGAEWSKIRTKRIEGYVLSKYLSDIRDYDASRGVVGASAGPVREVPAAADDDVKNFTRNFKAYAVRGTALYREPDERSRFICNVPLYEEVIVSHTQGDWNYAMYKNRAGYIRTDHLFKWDRLDPYAGDIPGCIIYPLLAFVNRTTDIRSYGDNGKKILKTMNPGSALCVELPDEQGRYKTPYWRTTGYITEEDIVSTIPVVPYDQAQPGDLISVMTTYYAVGAKTLQYWGRNWNIYLSTSMVSGSVLYPGEQYDAYKYIGPYRKSTGYKPAPIMSPHALMGFGGGTCQVNTTVYNTVIRVPLYVNHRKVHANVGIKYIPKGYDAAVGGGDINMIFTNTLPYSICFNFFVSDGVMTCCIFRARAG
ncbi:MAG: VanW family protein [Clostridia bacterium]|nr:VanW family protein [Clostridia bacterium]